METATIPDLISQAERIQQCSIFTGKQNSPSRGCPIIVWIYRELSARADDPTNRNEAGVLIYYSQRRAAPDGG
jgi:hypothetical protein